MFKGERVVQNTGSCYGGTRANWDGHWGGDGKLAQPIVEEQNGGINAGISKTRGRANETEKRNEDGGELRVVGRQLSS